MLEVLNHLFAAVCGQNPDHMWAPGGVWLPCCQRCLGLYCGACVAALLQLWVRPKLTSRFLEIHGVFLLLMVPFGFHWLPQGPVLRTITGVLFGFGVVAFLWLPLAARKEDRSSSLQWCHAIALAGMLALVPLLAAEGGRIVAYFLSALASWGLVGLALLVCANIGLGLAEMLRILVHRSAEEAFSLSSSGGEGRGEEAPDQIRPCQPPAEAAIGTLYPVLGTAPTASSPRRSPPEERENCIGARVVISQSPWQWGRVGVLRRARRLKAMVLRP